MTRAYFTWQEAILRSKLEPTTKLVCHTIGCHMAMDGTGCFPSYALIADESGLSRRSVIEHVAKAVQCGYLEVDSRQRENGSSTSNNYRPVMPGVVNVVHQGGEPAALGGGEPAAPQITTHSSNHSSNTCARFDEFWSAYPRKVSKAQCEAIWVRKKLDREADTILARLKRFKASQQWQEERFIPHPSTFLNQERWRSEPPAAPSKPGELRLRETTAEDAEEARIRAEFMRLAKANPGKSEAKIHAMMQQSGRDA